MDAAPLERHLRELATLSSLGREGLLERFWRSGTLSPRRGEGRGKEPEVREPPSNTISSIARTSWPVTLVPHTTRSAQRTSDSQHQANRLCQHL
jgi:hypothetical protein